MNKRKSGFTPSKSEFLLLCGLIIVIILAVSLNYLILPAWDNFNNTMENFTRQGLQLEVLKAEHSNIENYRSQDAQLSEELNGLRAKIPSYLSEEEIIMALDDAAEKSGLTLMSLSFEGTSVEPRDSFLARLDLSASGQTTSAVTSGSVPGESVMSERLSISYSGSYEDLMGFISYIDNEARQIYLRSASLSRTDDGSLTGTISVLVFSTTAEAQTDYPGYYYATPDMPGSLDPFAAFESYRPGGSAGSSLLETPDFYVILNTYDDNSNKILFGKYPQAATQITSDNNRNTSATLTLSAEGDRCNYTYTLGSSRYSGYFTLTAGQQNITVNVLSRARKNSEDNVGITLNVENNTELNAIIAVKNDDTVAPRFVLGTISGRVQVKR